MHKLVQEAAKARLQAYAPYSGFKVGAAVLTSDNRIYCGCNIENVSYGLTICAERTAIFKAVCDGQANIESIAVVADTIEPVAPCGACLQVMAEFSVKKIIIANLKGSEKEVYLKDLLPYAFNKTVFDGDE